MRAPLALTLILLPACAVVVDHREQTPDADAPTHLVDEGALGPYSASVRAGNLLFVSGKIGRIQETSDGQRDFATEVHTSIDAVQTELGRSGLALADVVSATVYLTDMARYADFNAIYAARFPSPYPARACVAVAALPAGASVEIQVVARRP